MEDLREQAATGTADSADAGGTSKKESFFSRIGTALGAAKDARTGNRHALVIDLSLFALGFVFARRQVLFGSYPLAIALISVLPTGVWQTMLGSLVGAFSLGREGLVYAVISGIVTFLRVIISGGRADSETPIFSEGLLLRMSSAVIGGFVAAVYRALLSGIAQNLLFGISMILLPPLLTFAFSGIFDSGISLSDLIYSDKSVLSLSGKEERERGNILFFQCSAATLLFFTALSLSEVQLLGIGAADIFVCFAVLLIARRFGALRALAAGFISALGIGGTFAVCAALAGLASGLLFSFGVGYALIGGGAALGAWGAYSGGITGLLTSLPEYSIAAALAFPFLKNLPREATEAEAQTKERGAEDMVGTMALAYRARQGAALDALETSLSSISALLEAREGNKQLTESEYEQIIISTAEEECRKCTDRALCSAEDIAPIRKNSTRLAKMLAAGEPLTQSDLNTGTEFCEKANALLDRITERVSAAEREAYRAAAKSAALEYELIAKLLNESRLADGREREIDATLTASLGTVFLESGFPNGIIRAFGDRKKHFIMAGEDESGEKISSPELRSRIEETAGLKLGTPEYFRHGKMALMECDTRRAYKAECATATLSADGKEVSGDTTDAFETLSDRFFCLLSDGMGRGKEARESSEFVSGFLRAALELGTSKESLLHLLNAAMRRQSEECSATVDLFELDLLSGEACFIKSGAAPSYIKRGSSIFRIKSRTAPIGLLSGIDTEKIRAEVRAGDYVILLSDGVSQSAEESAWLFELLSRTPPKSLGAFADSIIKAARKNCTAKDDMSAAVIRISEI